MIKDKGELYATIHIPPNGASKYIAHTQTLAVIVTNIKNSDINKYKLIFKRENTF